MNEETIITGGAIESPPDHRNVYLNEVVGAPDKAPEKPEEFFSPYSVAAILANGINYQRHISSCVAESTDKSLESIHFWVNTPDEENPIDYLFVLTDGKLQLSIKSLQIAKNFSPRFLYALMKSEDGIPDFSGTYIKMAGVIPQKYGSATEQTYPSNYSLTEQQFKNRSGIPPEAYKEAEQFKIERYAFTDRSLESYQLGIWTSVAHVIVGGYPLGNSNLNEQPQKPPTIISGGHANCWFGYARGATFTVGSYSKDFGLTLYLKIYNHPQFGKIFVRGTPGDYVVRLYGLHQLNTEWFGGSNIFQAVTYFDKKFSPELEDRIKMLKAFRIKDKPEVYVVLEGKAYWVTPGGAPGTTYEDGRGKLWPDVGPEAVIQITEAEASMYPLVGLFGKASILDYVRFLFLHR